MATITEVLKIPPAIGGTTPAAGAFTTLTASSTVNGAVLNKQGKNLAAAAILEVCTSCRGLWMFGQGASSVEIVDENLTAHAGALTGGLNIDDDQSYKGLAYSLVLNGTTNYIDFGDSADFTFGDGTTDSPFSVLALVYVSLSPYDRTVLSKYDLTSGSEQTEWLFYITSLEKLRFQVVDLSAERVSCRRIQDGTMSEGWHFLVGTYDGSGGATAADGIKLYVDGVEVASTATNSATYVAMENTTAPVYGGAQTHTAGELHNPFSPYMGLLGLEASELTAAQVWRLWKIVEGTYGL